MPRVIGPVPSDRWEKEVRRQLEKQLPDNWVVICNVAWALNSGSGYVRDGEADFVVLAPNLGLVVLEVKGSRLVRVREDGSWARVSYGRRGQPEKEDIIRKIPPEQACSNAHTLSTLLKDEFGQNHFPGLHAWLVVYPNGEIEGSLDTYDDSTIVTRSRMNQLGSAVRGALLSKGGEHIGKNFTPEFVDRSAKVLSNQRFRVVAVDTEIDVEEDLVNIDELTRQQFAALRGAFDLPRVAIIGPAGSGKTLLAIWKLSALIEEGKKALFVCFNTVLTENLRLHNPDIASHIYNVDSLFMQFASPSSTDMNKPDFFSKLLPELVDDKASALAEKDKYDAIIIDEGQDFGDYRIVALYQLLKDDRSDSNWLYFADNKQDLYGQGTDDILGAEVIFRLYDNCRNTKRINAVTNRVCSGKVTSMPGVPSGEKPIVKICKKDQMARVAWSLVSEVSPDGGAVFLSPYKLVNSCMSNALKANGLEVTKDLSLLGKPGFVYFSTIKSFKGLEASHIVFIHADLPNTNQALADEDLYVAFTRATARLDVVTSNPDAGEWLSTLVKTVD